VRHGAAALVCALALAAASPAAADGLDEVLGLLAARRHGEARFVEQQFLAMLKRPLESSGELRYDAPDRLEKHTVEPRDETLSIAGDVLTVRRGGARHTLKAADYPLLLPFIESIRATLAGDRAQLERRFEIEFGGTEAHWAMRLVPQDAALRKTIASIQIDGARDNLLRVEIRQADGDHSLMTLRNFTSP
jgi:hypothetical protein